LILKIGMAIKEIDSGTVSFNVVVKLMLELAQQR
jgi:hypothetical protein